MKRQLEEEPQSGFISAKKAIKEKKSFEKMIIKQMPYIPKNPRSNWKEIVKFRLLDEENNNFICAIVRNNEQIIFSAIKEREMSKSTGSIFTLLPTEIDFVLENIDKSGEIIEHQNGPRSLKLSIWRKRYVIRQIKATSFALIHIHPDNIENFKIIMRKIRLVFEILSNKEINNDSIVKIMFNEMLNRNINELVENKENGSEMSSIFDNDSDKDIPEEIKEAAVQLYSDNFYAKKIEKMQGLIINAGLPCDLDKNYKKLIREAVKDPEVNVLKDFFYFIPYF